MLTAQQETVLDRVRATGRYPVVNDEWPDGTIQVVVWEGPDAIDLFNVDTEGIIEDA